MHARETRKPRLFRPRPAPAQPLIWLYIVATLVLALVFTLSPARASEFDPEPEPEPEGLQMKIGDEWVATLAMDTTVDMQVRGLLAEVTVRQTYRNDASEWREGRYLLPLPESGAVGALTLRVGERLIVGEIREKAEAEAIYQAAAASGQRASLVSQNRPNLFQTRVANIGPGEEVEIEVRYWQPVAFRDGVFSLHLPLMAETKHFVNADRRALMVRRGLDGPGPHGWAGNWPDGNRHLTWGCISMKNKELEKNEEAQVGSFFPD